MWGTTLMDFTPAARSRSNHSLDLDVLGRGDGDDGRLDPVGGHHAGEVGGGPGHRHAVDAGAGLVGVVVDEGHRPVVAAHGAEELPHQPLAGAAGAHQQGAAADLLLAEDLAVDPLGDPQRPDEAHGDDALEDDDRPGQEVVGLEAVDQGVEQEDHRGRGQAGLDRGRQLAQAHEDPGDEVELEGEQHGHLDQHQHRQPEAEDRPFVVGDVELEAQGEGQDEGQGNEDDVAGQEEGQALGAGGFDQFLPAHAVSIGGLGAACPSPLPHWVTPPGFRGHCTTAPRPINKNPAVQPAGRHLPQRRKGRKANSGKMAND